MRIVVDANMPLGKEFFSTVGDVIAVPPREIKREHLLTADALVVRSVKKITGELLENTPVKFVGTCTAGYDHLDIATIESLGKYWCNAPGSNANSVVEYIFSVFAALDLSWCSATVGIVGCGQVGGLLHQRLKRLNVECCCYDPFLSVQDNTDLGDFEKILACDIVCIHAPYTNNGPYPTHHLFNKNNLHKLKSGAVLINAGRGGVIDNMALFDLLKNRPDIRCVLDVWENEPSINIDLLQKVNIATPHIAGHSIDGKMKGTAMVYKRFCEFFNLREKTTLNELDQMQKPDLIKVNADRVEAACKQAVQSVYDVEVDYQKWLALLKTASDVATIFDNFRKNYPARREFYHYQVEAGLDNKIKSALAILGFQTQ